MKVVKTQVCLYIYELLRNKQIIYANEIKEKFELEDKTFTRYIQEIRAYLHTFCEGLEISYNKSKQRYYLVDKNEK